jgi:Ca2+-transporting ATPase
MSRNNAMAEAGLRVLAIATKTSDTIDAQPYEGLRFLGLVGMIDPPRSDVHESLEQCRNAGIDVIMVTGDQAVTARNVGLAVGLIDEERAEVVNGQDLESLENLSEEERRRLLGIQIFARVSPKQKLDLITLHQKNGSIVAMTGDGVNDAPALKKADIGVAMGVRGTQVAREAAHMVLKDDAFSTIIAAVEEGRVIFDNIRKSILYLLSCNVSEIMIVALASLFNAPLPILPLQILFLNLVTDVFPALALGVGEGDPGILKRPPRDPKEPVLSKQHWLAIGGYGIAITIAVLGALSYALVTLNMEERRAVTVSFLTLAFAQLWHVFNMRDRGSSFLHNDITRNRYIWGSLLLCVGLLLAAVYLPGLNTVLKVVDPGTNGWILILVMSIVPWIIGQLWKIGGTRRTG